MNVERRTILKSFAPGRLLTIEEEGSPEEREAGEILDRIDKTLLVLKWLELRSEAIGLGLFVSWDETKLDELTGKEGEWDTAIKKELSELRLAIRKERNERWQFWELRLKVLAAFATALTGAIGVTVGLIATLRK